MTKQKLERRVQKMYDDLPEYLKEDVLEALKWAQKTLTELEGLGHTFHILGENENLVSCSFSKPCWSGDHSGRPMECGATAVCRAVCEYLNGM